MAGPAGRLVAESVAVGVGGAATYMLRSDDSGERPTGQGGVAAHGSVMAGGSGSAQYYAADWLHMDVAHDKAVWCTEMERMDDVFKALADPGRRRLLDALNERDAQSLGELCAVLSIARQSVSRHLAVLEAAGLVTTTRDGRQKLHHLNADPIVGPAGRWIGRYRTQATWWDPAAHTAPAGEFTYTTYIRTTPERLWHAVTNSDNSVRCMGHGMESDWIKGSVYGWVENGQRLDDPEQLILESDPYQRLAFTFPAFTGAPHDESAAGVARSRVTFDLEPFDDQVELTVTHRAQQADGAAPRWATERWPFKLSALKTELEQVTPPDR